MNASSFTISTNSGSAGTSTITVAPRSSSDQIGQKSATVTLTNGSASAHIYVYQNGCPPYIHFDNGDTEMVINAGASSISNQENVYSNTT